MLELTQSFMIPLVQSIPFCVPYIVAFCSLSVSLQERYLASLMPLQRNINPYRAPPALRPFDTEEFLKTLDHSGPQLTSGLKGDWVGLYRSENTYRTCR